jgi:hypothetical protein
MKLNRWGLASIVLVAISFGVGPICHTVFHDLHPCLLPYILFLLCALAFAIIAGVRGSKWWLLACLLPCVLAIQGILGLLSE